MELTVSGEAVAGPVSAKLIQKSINSLDGEGDSFAVLGKGEQSYIQTSGGPEHGFVLEYRDGSEAQHYSCSNFELTADEVTRAFQSYLADDGRWKIELKWESQIYDYSSNGRRLNFGVGLAVVGVAVAAILVWKFFFAT